MSLFSSDMRVANTAAPSFQSQANVSQYGWTGADQGHYNQLIQYVDECRKIYLSLEEKIIYIEEILKEVESIDAQVKYVEQMTQAVIEAKDQTFEYATEVQDMYNEVKPIYENFVLSYTDFNTKYTDFLAKYPEVLEAATNAKVSETNAAQSAQDAADIVEELRKGQVYRGTWNIETNNSYPPRPDTNSVWDVVLNESSVEWVFDGQTWYWGDRILYLKDDNAFTQIESGSTVTSVNHKTGAVTLTYQDVHAAPEGFGLGMEQAFTVTDADSSPLTWNGGKMGWVRFISTTLNKPSDQGGVVLIQRYQSGSKSAVSIVLFGANRRTYYRRWSGDVWADWTVGYDTLNKPTPNEIGALNKAGDTMAGTLGISNFALVGKNNAAILRDFGNGNVVMGAGLSDTTGNPGDLYLGYKGSHSGTAGFNTRNVRLESPLFWGTTKNLANAEGLNSEELYGPIRTEKDSANVLHTVVGGTDTVNRGRTIIAAGECGKHIADNIATGAEQVHIGGDNNDGVFVHTGLKDGWGTDTHKITKFQAGEIYVGKGTSRVYHQGFKPTAADVGVTNVGMGGGAVNILDLGITDLNKITTSGHYYTSNATDLNRPSAAAGPIVHVQGAAGYQQYVRDNDFKFRGFTGTTFKPWQTVYHTGNVPTAAAVGALPITGGTLTGALTVGGSITANNGRFLCNSSGVVPMFEMHIPGKVANAMYTVDNGNLIFCKSNGSGANAATYAQLNATVADFTGKVVSRYNQSRSWVAQGAAAFSGTESTISSGGLTAVASQIVHITGVAGGIEYGHGYLADGTEINNHGHALFCNNGTNNYNRYWIFRNNGGQQSPSNFRISPDGHMSGNAYEGYEDHFQWSIANLGATTDARMTKAIGRSTQNALDVVNQLQVNRLVWNEESGAVHTTRDVKVTEFGLIAQEVEEVDASLVKTIRVGGENPTKTKTLDTASMLALAFKAIQELRAEVQDLKTQLNK